MSFLIYSDSPASHAPILDRGASFHILPSASSFINCSSVNIPITMANGATILATTRRDPVLRNGSQLSSFAIRSLRPQPLQTSRLCRAAQYLFASCPHNSRISSVLHFIVTNFTSLLLRTFPRLRHHRRRNLPQQPLCFDPLSIQVLNSDASESPQPPFQHSTFPFTRFMVPTSFFLYITLGITAIFPPFAASSPLNPLSNPKHAPKHAQKFPLPRYPNLARRQSSRALLKSSILTLLSRSLSTKSI